TVVALHPFIHTESITGNCATNLKPVMPIEGVSHKSLRLRLELPHDIRIDGQLIAKPKILQCICTKSCHIGNMRNSPSPVPATPLIDIRDLPTKIVNLPVDI